MTTVTNSTHGATQPVESDRWTEQAVRSLGMTTDIETTGAILGIGRTKAYELVQTGEFPVRVLRIGRRYRVPVPAILQLLNGDQ